MALKNRKPQLWTFYLSSVACLISIFTFIGVLFYSDSKPLEVEATEYNSDQIITEVNKRRLENGVLPLRKNDRLTIAAQNKTRDMVKNSYFSHVSPVDGAKWSDFIKKAGYNYDEAGENLANGFESVPEMVDAWMESPSHRENILNATVEETGVGIATGRLNGYPTIFVTQVFGRIDGENSPIQKSRPSQIQPRRENSFGRVVIENKEAN